MIMKLYPGSAYLQLEFDKIKDLLTAHCQFEYAKNLAGELEVHTERVIIERELKQTHEYLQLIQNSIYFPNDHILNLSRELKLLEIPGAVLSEADIVELRKLAVSFEKIF